MQRVNRLKVVNTINNISYFDFNSVTNQKLYIFGLCYKHTYENVYFGKKKNIFFKEYTVFSQTIDICA